MSDQGKANYEGYHASIPGSTPVPFDELPHLERLHWDAGAYSVEAWLAEAPVDEDAPGNQAAKVIVVTEVGYAGKTTERRFRADELKHHADVGVIELYRDSRRIALYANGTWANFRDADAEVPDATAIALNIAKRALNEIVSRARDGGDLPFGRPEIGTIAADALNEIWNETEG